MESNSIASKDRIVDVVLEDQYEQGDSTKGSLIINDTGISIRLNGYSDCSTNDDHGVPVYIEKYNGSVRLIVFADINREEPTHVISHVISLDGAKNINRADEGGNSEH